MDRLTPAVMPRPLALATCFGMAVLLSSCGKTLGTLVTEAVDSCIDLRNPAFVGGRASSALETPFPDSLSQRATKLAYQRALTNYERIAESAQNQVTLVCAMELASYYKHGDVAVFLWKYTRHPDAGVAQNARRLLRATQDPLPGSFQ